MAGTKVVVEGLPNFRASTTYISQSSEVASLEGGFEIGTLQEGAICYVENVDAEYRWYSESTTAPVVPGVVLPFGQLVGTPGRWIMITGGGGTGPQGPQGAQGPQGSGAQGAQGTQGVQGAQGNQGAQGTQGVQGSSGVQGPQGAQGAQGPQGAQGQGVQGAQGAQGPQGNAGAQGSQGTSGTQGPQGNAGAQGVQGNAGAQGPQGNAGAQGAQGSAGAQGAQGNAGAQGTQGAQGPQGVQGSQGPQGVQGPQGASSAQMIPRSFDAQIVNTFDATDPDEGVACSWDFSVLWPDMPDGIYAFRLTTLNVLSPDYAQHASEEFGLVKQSGTITAVRAYQGSWNSGGEGPTWISPDSGPVYYPTPPSANSNEAVTISISNTTTIETKVWFQFQGTNGCVWAVQITAISYSVIPT